MGFSTSLRAYGGHVLTWVALGALGVAGVLQYMNIRERRVLRSEIRRAAAREMLSAESYLKSIFEDPVALKDFQKKVDLVQDSWAKLKPFKVEATAHIMYKYLKSWDRGAAEIFDDKLDWMSQERIFNVMLSTLLGHLNDPDWLLENLIRLGHKHHALGVKPSHYLTMQNAILKSLEEQLGPAWNDDYYEAWTDVFSFISRMMIKAAYGVHDKNSRPHNPAEDKQVYGKTRPHLDQNSISTVMPREDVTASPPRASSPRAAAGRTNSPLAKHVRTGSPLSEAQEKP